MDRFDLSVNVARPDLERFFAKERGAPSKDLAQQVLRARSFAQVRGLEPNRRLGRHVLTQKELLHPKALTLLKNAALRLQLSGRAIVRCLRLARTIADMQECEQTMTVHVSEALSYRGTWSHDG